jgi:hypothetical protein
VRSRDSIVGKVKKKKISQEIRSRIGMWSGEAWKERKVDMGSTRVYSPSKERHGLKSGNGWRMDR